MKKPISTDQAPQAIGPYSQGISSRAGQYLFISGQLPINPATGGMPPAISEQTEQSLKNLQAILEAAGSGLGDVVKTTVYLADMNDFAAMNAVYARYFESPYPARAAVQVARLPKDALVEIDAIAVKQN